jgi:hypothetical protein
MKLLVLKALWGMTGSPREQVEKIAGAGYDGVEGSPESINRSEFRHMLADNGLKLINAVNAEDPEEWRKQLLAAAEDGPMKIVSFSGRDSMSRDEGCAFFEMALRAEEEVGIEVAHETHRGRLFFTPWDTAFYLRKLPSLKINADFSHWVCVLERLPEDRSADLALACERAIHIHTRVGYEEGPQVPDPSAPEYARQVRWHEEQWDRVRAVQEKAGREVITVTPEYGPPSYLHTLPHTNVPVADLWEVCLWAAKRIRQRWGDIA